MAIMMSEWVFKQGRLASRVSDDLQNTEPIIYPEDSDNEEKSKTYYLQEPPTGSLFPKLYGYTPQKDTVPFFIEDYYRYKDKVLSYYRTKYYANYENFPDKPYARYSVKLLTEETYIYDLITYCDKKFQNPEIECSELRNKCKSVVEELIIKEPKINQENLTWLKNGGFSSHKGCFSRLYYIQNADAQNTPDDNDFLSYNGCDKMLYFYTCRYALAYCSELIYALISPQILQSLQENYDQLDILSLGCGNAVDLLAFDYLAKNLKYVADQWGLEDVLKSEKFPGIKSYLGIDMCEQWDDIHGYIKSLFSAKDIIFKTGPEANVETFLDSNDSGLNGRNVLVISYLISIFYRSFRDEAVPNGEDPDSYAKRKMSDFYNKLIEKIIVPRSKDTPMLIIINDINGFQTFSTFVNLIEEKGLKIKGNPVMQYFDKSIHDSYTIPEGFSQIDQPKSIFDKIYNERGYTDPKNGKKTNYQQYYSAMMYLQSYQLILEVE